MAANVTGIGLVVVLVNFIKGGHIFAGGFIRNNMPAKINLFDALKFKFVSDNTFDVTVINNVLDLLGLQQFCQRHQYIVGRQNAEQGYNLLHVLIGIHTDS